MKWKWVHFSLTSNNGHTGGWELSEENYVETKANVDREASPTAWKVLIDTPTLYAAIHERARFLLFMWRVG